MIDKAKAVALREQGFNYEQIAAEVGCSVGWCKINLKGVTKDLKENDLVAKLVAMARTKKGITAGDIAREVKEVFPNDYSKEQKEDHRRNVNRIKAKVKAHEGVTVRPYWMPPEQARDMFYTMMQKIQDRDERDQEDIDEIRAEYGLDESYIPSIRYALYSLSAIGSKFLGYSVVHEIDRLSDVVDDLEKKNPAVVKQVSTGVAQDTIDYKDMEDFMY